MAPVCLVRDARAAASPPRAAALETALVRADLDAENGSAAAAAAATVRRPRGARTLTATRRRPGREVERAAEPVSDQPTSPLAPGPRSTGLLGPTRRRQGGLSRTDGRTDRLRRASTPGDGRRTRSATSRGTACASPYFRRTTVAPALRRSEPATAQPCECHGARHFLAAADFLAAFLAVDFLAVFLAAVFLAALLAAFLAGPLLAALGEQLGGALEGDRLDGVVLAEGGVVLAVGDVLAEAAGLHDHRLPGDRVVAELLQRRRGGGPAALLGLGVDRQRLVEGDREQLLLGVERAGVGALLEVRPVAAVLRGDLLAARRRRRPRAAATAA